MATSNPQNYVQTLKAADGKRIPYWHGWSDEIHTGLMSATTNHQLAVPVGANFCHIIVNSGAIYLDITNPITSIPTGFSKGTMKLLDNQEANYFYLPIGTANLNIYNSGATAVPVTVIFGRTRRMYQDVGAEFPKGDFG
jgi:hypothetical protein